MRHLTFLLFMLYAAAAFGQTPEVDLENRVRILLKDGTVVVGTIEESTDDVITLVTSSGVRMTIPRDQIRDMQELEGQQFYRMDPNRTRLLFAPTARPAGDRRGYVAFYEIFASFAAFGIGDAVTMAGGMTINPGSARLVYVAPKLTVYNNRTTSVAVGGIGVGVVGGDGGDDNVGLLFGIATFGPSYASVSTGLGFGYIDGELSYKPAWMFGGELQLSNNVKIVSENYVIAGLEDGFLMSGGIRFFGDALAADIGIITAPGLIFDEGSFLFIPWLGFAYNFSR